MNTYEKKVLFSDLDANERMTMGSLIDALQDCVNINSESIGKGIEFMMERRRTWFAVGWNIEIKRFPKMFENLTVKTWPYDFTAALGYRNVIVKDESGNDIVCADSIWTLVDMDTGSVCKIEEEDTRGYDLEERYPMEKLGRKLKLPKEFITVDEVTVKKSDIDYNGHMSNGKYIILANEYIPMDANVNRIRVEYKNQARYWEVLTIEQAEDKENSSLFIKIAGKEQGDIKAIVEFRMDA